MIIIYLDFFYNVIIHVSAWKYFAFSLFKEPGSVNSPITKLTDQSLSEFIYTSTDRHLHQQTQCSITQ